MDPTNGLNKKSRGADTSRHNNLSKNAGDSRTKNRLPHPRNNPAFARNNSPPRTASQVPLDDPRIKKLQIGSNKPQSADDQQPSKKNTQNYTVHTDTDSNSDDSIKKTSSTRTRKKRRKYYDAPESFNDNKTPDDKKQPTQDNTINIQPANKTNDTSDLSNSTDNKNSVENKSIFSKITNSLNKHISKTKLSIAFTLVAMAIIFSITLGGGPIIFLSIVALGVAGFIANEVINYFIKQEQENDNLEKELNDFMKEFEEKQERLALAGKISNPHKFTPEEDETVIDPTKLTIKDKLKHAAKILYSPIMGLAILSLAIAATILTGGIAPIIVAVCFTSLCIFKGVLDFLDFRAKKQKFLEKNKDALPNTDTNDDINNDLTPS